MCRYNLYGTLLLYKKIRKKSECLVVRGRACFKARERGREGEREREREREKEVERERVSSASLLAPRCLPEFLESKMMIQENPRTRRSDFSSQNIFILIETKSKNQLCLNFRGLKRVKHTPYLFLQKWFFYSDTVCVCLGRDLNCVVMPA